MNGKSLFVFALLAIGCDANAGADIDPAPLAQQSAAPTYYKDVKPILDTKCTQCHAANGIGGFSLTTFDDARTRAQAIAPAVQSGRMPPWFAEGPLDQYIGDRRLTDAQKATIAAWVQGGTLEGDPADTPPEPAQAKRGLPRVDQDLKINRPYTPPSSATDIYRCFPIDWPYNSKKYITGLGIVPDRTEMVHHAIVYLIPPGQVAAVRAQDALDGDSGYDCLGTLGGNWLTSYEPGGYGEENPGGIGFEVEPGSVMLLQMHYNTLRGRGADRSSVQVMVADRVQREGKVNLIMNAAWVLGGMPIPANNPDVVFSWTGRPGGLNALQSYDLYWADLHMHTLGHAGSIGIVRSGSRSREPLLSIPDWQFEWQETYRFTKPVRLNPGDQLYVECRFDNTAANQMVVNGRRNPVRRVNWGEKTTDEMCLGNVVSTPVSGW